jgi:O-antigen ligase
MTATASMSWGVVAALAWGALAFGAVYPWAYWPLIIWTISLAACGFLPHGSPLPRALLYGWLLLNLAVLTQLVPVSRSVMAAISPSTPGFIQQTEPAVDGTNGAADADQSSWHPLSIRPSDTWQGLMWLFTIGVFILGMVRSLTPVAIARIATGVLILGSILAVVGILQKSSGTSRIYGVWEPFYETKPFGPFINRNHFAGWMAMAIPLTMGYWCGRFTALRRRIGPTRRQKVLWLASEDANRLILLAFGILLMCLSLVLTVSRSGIGCFAVVVFSASLFGARLATTKAVRTGLISCVFLGGMTILTWTGVDPIVKRFAKLGGPVADARLVFWRDTIGVVSAFPAVGTGLNTYETAMTSYNSAPENLHPAQAHNDYLQIAAEGGVLIGLPAIVLIALFGAEVWRRFGESRDPFEWWMRAGAVTGLATIAIQEAVDFSLRMPGNATLFAVLAAIALHRHTPSRVSAV